MPVIVNDVPLDCLNQAAIHYHVPAPLILAVMRTEGGRNGLAKPNKNGTVNYGVMQINTVWLRTLKYHGYTAHDLQYNPCKNIEAGTWIISQSLTSSKALQKGIGNYHSHTPHLNQQYTTKILASYQMIQHIIVE